jgi:Clr5 domain
MRASDHDDAHKLRLTLDLAQNEDASPARNLSLPFNWWIEAIFRRVSSVATLQQPAFILIAHSFFLKDCSQFHRPVRGKSSMQLVPVSMTLLPLAPSADSMGRCIVPAPRPMPTNDDWTALQPEIENLYVRERRKLRYIMQYMETKYGFKAT